MSLSMSTLIATSSISKHIPCLHSTSFTFNNPTSFLKNKNLVSYKHYGPMLTRTRRSFIVSSNLPPSGVPSPSGSMSNWILGIVLTFVVPFFTHKWGPLLLLKNKVDTAVDMAEHLAETIEVVAEKVDHVIDSITDELPKDSKLRNELESIDAIVEGVAKSAHIANELIDKVEKVEDRLESLILDEERNVAASKQVEVVEKTLIPTHKPNVE